MENQAVVEALPETGLGSAPGPRWFVSCRYPNPTITIKPAVGKTDVSNPVKGVYAEFRSFAKPNEMQGRGKRGRENWDNTDMNDSQKWAIYPAVGPILEPGAEPEDGYKDGAVKWVDEHGAEKAAFLKAAAKKHNRAVIDRLRLTGFYARTRQNNEVDASSELVEITWNPIPHCGHIVGAVTRGRVAIKGGKIVAVDDKGVAAPAETAPAVPAPRVPSLGKSRKAVAA